jgi:hypothetical protein
MAVTHRFTESGGSGALHLDGAPATTHLLPDPALRPLPESGDHWSVACCAPSSDTGNADDVPSLATQPSIGTVNADATPFATLSLKNLS